MQNNRRTLAGERNQQRIFPHHLSTLHTTHIRTVDGLECSTSARISRRSGPLRSPSFAPSYCDLQPLRLALFDRHLSSELTPEKLHSNNWRQLIGGSRRTLRRGVLHGG